MVAILAQGKTRLFENLLMRRVRRTPRFVQVYNRAEKCSFNVATISGSAESALGSGSKKPYSAGSTTSVSNVELTNPLITAIASGHCTSEPTPVATMPAILASIASCTPATFNP
jgi:hypothetical protein